MRFGVLFGLLALALCAEETETERVAVLTTAAFDKFVADNELVFVEFYAPWCGHCKSMAKDYEKLAQGFEAEGGRVKIAKVDATVENDLATRFGVKGFPTLKLFVGGVPIDYKGGRTEKEMRAWLVSKSQSRPELLAFADEGKLQEKPVSVLFLLPENEPEAFKAFSAFAMQYDNVPFFYANDRQFWDKNNFSERFGLVILRGSDEGPKYLVNDKAPGADEMRTFFESVRHPLVSEFSQEVAERVFGSEQSAAFLFGDKTDSALSAAFLEAARTTSGIVFATSKITSGLDAKLSEFLGITAEHEGSVRFIKFEGDNVKKFKCADTSATGIATCAKDFLAGTLPLYFKSQPVPAANTGAVREIVGDNFQAEVLDAPAHVLLEAYAPWCGHCQKFEPIYQQLAEKLAHVSGLVLAKMDAASNEHPAMQVRAFPTIRLFKRDAKDTPVEYEGKRELSELLEFLKRETGLELETAESASTVDAQEL